VAIFVVRRRPPSVPRVKAPPVEVLERHTWLPIALIAAGSLTVVGASATHLRRLRLRRRRTAGAVS
jgi:hypothetical protein